jgi:glycosyltransferase involved in cell wall biosynthesis
MRILVDCHSFDKERFQGVNTYIIGVYKEMMDRAPSNWHFIFYCADSAYLRSVFNDYNNLTFYQSKNNSFLYRFVYGLSKAIRDVKADILHVQYKSPLFKFSNEWVTVHDVLFVDYPDYFPRVYRFLSYWLYKRSVRRAEFVNTVSEYSRHRIEEAFGVDYVVNTGMGLSSREIDVSLSTKDDINSILRSRFILCVSRIEPRKNQAYLLKLFSMMKSDANLVLVGTQTHSYPEFEALINNKSIANVFWLKNLDYFDLKRFYSRAHLTVYPSLCEGFGLPPMESILYGTPVLFNANTAMSEYKELSVFDLSLEDIEDMSTRLDRVIDSPKIRVKESVVIDRFSWAGVSKRIIKNLELYD